MTLPDSIHHSTKYGNPFATEQRRPSSRTHNGPSTPHCDAGGVECDRGSIGERIEDVKLPSETVRLVLCSENFIFD